MKVGVTTIFMTDSVRDIYRLSAWLSPAFPVGAYTYSSGLEYAIEEGLVAHEDLLQGWLADLFRFGSGAFVAGFFCLAHCAAVRDDAKTLG